jgi:trk system potassium uptake protein
VSSRRGAARPLNPARAIVAGFLGAILVGTLLLRLPIAHAGDAHVGWLDALFTATSAVCVTGLVVLDTGSAWSVVGQVVILLLIKAGGLGILSLGALLALATGRRLGFGQRLGLQAQTNALTVGGAVRFVRRLLLFTTSVEALGALLLALRFVREEGAAGLFSALFHAVSAFNNAGFSLQSDSLRRYADDPFVLLVVALLVVIGGLGLVVVMDVALRFGAAAEGRHRATLHTRLALATTVVLVLGGWGAILALEWANPRTLAALEPHDRPLAALFQAVTPRTAGFTTVAPSDYRTPTSLVTMFLMLVGGNPGSTAGGLKTTTLAVLVVAALALARGHPTVTVAGRTIDAATMVKAAVLLTVALLFVGVAATLLTLTEPAVAPLAVLFETVSAFATVGLSMGITRELSLAGRAVLVVVMLVGRVGLLTVALALARDDRFVAVRYPSEDVVVG